MRNTLRREREYRSIDREGFQPQSALIELDDCAGLNQSKAKSYYVNTTIGIRRDFYRDA